MRRFFSAAAVCAVIAALVCGCNVRFPEGYEPVKSARESYEALDSARVTMTDLSDGRQIMDFMFYINSGGEMVLSYYGVDGEEEQFAYSNGAEYFYKLSGDDGWSVISPSDESYIYNIYNREYRYPYARGGVFFLDAGAVESSEVRENGDGSLEITYIYDAEKLNSDSALNLEGVSGFSALTTTFCINADGYITEFTETGTLTDDSGAERDINMKITVSQMNEVTDIPYPVDRLIK